MTKRLDVHDLGTPQPTLCLYDPETETCLVLATFEQPSKAEALGGFLEKVRSVAEYLGWLLDD